MDIKTKDGIAEPLPLSDIQLNNRKLDVLKEWVKALVILLAILGILSLGYLFWLTWKVIHYGVVNNIVRACL